MYAVGLLLTAWLLADLLSGVFHWWEDQYVDDSWPVLGKLVGAPNQQHHADPMAFTRHGYWHRNWTTIVPAAIGFAVSWPHPLMCAAFVFVSQANEVHYWSHVRCNWFVRMFQETGVLQHPASHSRHHRAPFDCRYCVMSDLVNPVLDAFEAWWFIEGAVYLLFGIRSRRLELIYE